MYVSTLILCIFGVFIITTIVNSNDTNTKKYLRGINQNCIDNAFKQQINEIITAAITTTSQKNIINYSLTICDIHLDPNYNNYEEYGMDNDYKMNNYSMIVLSIGSVIEDVYRRAMNGETHRGLSEQRLVTQTEPLMPPNMYGIQVKQVG